MDGRAVYVGNPNEVNRLNNRPQGVSTPNPIGTGIILWVHPGDKISMEVQAKYANFNSSNTNILGSLAPFLASTFITAPVIDGTPIFNILDDPGFSLLPAWSNLDQNQPRAFLNYLLFDNDNKLVDFNFDQVSSSANVANAGPHEKLSLSDIEIKKEGFMYIYLSNLSDQNMDVYFDDLKISHTYSKIVAGGDFYPFGLVIEDRQIKREQYRHGYQGQYSEKDDETGWNHFELREYDVVIGRAIVPDPKRQFQSPFIWVGNNPTKGVDPTGGESPIFDEESGVFLGLDKNGWEGPVLFMSYSQYKSLGGTLGLSRLDATTLGLKKIEQMSMSDESWSNLITFIAANKSIKIARPDGSGVDRGLGLGFSGKKFPVGRGYADLSDPKNPKSISLPAYRGGRYSFNTGIYVDAHINEMTVVVNNNHMLEAPVFFKGGVWEIINTAVHERDHQGLGPVNVYSEDAHGFAERRAIEAQMKHPSWKYTSSDYKQAIQSYLQQWQK